MQGRVFSVWANVHDLPRRKMFGAGNLVNGRQQGGVAVTHDGNTVAQQNYISTNYTFVARDMAPVARLSARDLSLWVTAIGRGADPSFGGNSSADLDGMAREIHKAIPWLGRKAAEGLAHQYVQKPSADPAAWAIAAEMTACRVGLLVCDDLPSAVQMVERTKGERAPDGDTISDLIRFWVSDTAVSFRRSARQHGGG